jgi:hypothetical protein
MQELIGHREVQRMEQGIDQQHPPDEAQGWAYAADLIHAVSAIPLLAVRRLRNRAITPAAKPIHAAGSGTGVS